MVHRSHHSGSGHWCERLLYVRQSAPGIGADNAMFSVPEINDIGSGLKSIKELGTFSAIDFTILGWESHARSAPVLLMAITLT